MARASRSIAMDRCISGASAWRAATYGTRLPPVQTVPSRTAPLAGSTAARARSRCWGRVSSGKASGSANSGAREQRQPDEPDVRVALEVDPSLGVDDLDAV